MASLVIRRNSWREYVRSMRLSVDSAATVPGDSKKRTCTTSGSSSAIRTCTPNALSSPFSWWRATAGMAIRRSETATPVDTSPATIARLIIREAG